MNLTPLQLECMQLWADKTLSFGCVVEISDTYYDAKINKETNIWNRIKIIWNDIIEWDYIVVWWIIKNKIIQIFWHPITYSRLCYLRFINPISSDEKLWLKLEYHLFENPELYNQNILDWDETTISMVLDFLLSIQQNKPSIKSNI